MGYKEIEIPFTLLSNNEDSNNLAILLPGAGYTVQAPLLYYSTGVFLNKSFDVLQVNYSYNDKSYDNFSMDEIGEAIKHDVHVVIDKVLDDKSYEYFYLIGKSLGTIAMASELKRDAFKDAKAVWLTPLLQRDDVFETMLKSINRGLCFIGDNDRHYNEERFEQLVNNTNIVSRLFPNVNHSLQNERDPVNSIDVLKTVVKEINEL
ncbi:alpha/beta hydrolase [Viridibacillus arvi]|uniref:alpha/beta hydrolase n=1 Tax=Viridibacillus arvi TaxID=263475 RepID=UPI0034CD22FD